MITEKVMGIDLGTTNSVVGVLDAADRELILARHGPRGSVMFPSAVAWDQGGKLFVGDEAKQRRGLDPDPILSVKRQMGMSLTTDIAGRKWTPVEISALILQALAQRMRATIAATAEPFEIPRAVITIPAHFKHDPQADTTRAGEKAGLEVVELLHEPIAAATHYCWQRERGLRRRGVQAPPKDEEHFVVWDLGGGTFDASVLTRFRSTRGFEYRPLGVLGDRLLGGDEFDLCVAQDLFAAILRLPGVRFAGKEEQLDKLRRAKLRVLAEQVKCALTDSERVQLPLSDVIADDAGRPVSLTFEYSRGQFEERIRERIEGALKICDKALEGSGLGLDKIDTILMVGGSSRIPLVQRMVLEHLCTGRVKARCARPILHAPDECVGAGAALKAASHFRHWRAQRGAARLHFKGYASAARTHETLTIESLDTAKGHLELDDSVKLLARGATTIGGVLPGEGRRLVHFENVSLAPSQRNTFSLSLPTRSGTELAGFDFDVWHDPDFVEPLGPMTAANVLAFELRLQVRGGHRRAEVVQLAPRLSPLPGEFQHTFEAPTSGQEIVLPLYADHVLIRKVRVRSKVALPRGSRVLLRVHVDAAQRIRCSGRPAEKVAARADGEPGEEGSAFDVAVESPVRRGAIGRKEFNELRARAETLMNTADSETLRKHAMAVTRLLTEIGSALDRGDESRVIERTEELQGLLEQMEAGDGFDPTRHELRETARSCTVILDWIEERGGTTLDVAALRKRLEHNLEEAERAAGRAPPDRALYASCAYNLENLARGVRAEMRRMLPLDERASISIRQARRELADVDALDLTEAERRRLVEIGAALDALQSLVASEPGRALEGSEREREALEKIGAAHAPPPGAEDPLTNEEIEVLLGKLRG